MGHHRLEQHCEGDVQFRVPQDRRGNLASPSPDGGDRILRDQRIGREQGQSANDGLTDQHAIEWILVQLRQLGAEKGGGLVERKRLNLVAPAFLGNQDGRRTRQRKFVQAVLDRDLPRRNRTQEGFVGRVGEMLACLGRQAGVAGDDP